MEEWQSGRMRLSWKQKCRKVPGVRIPPLPKKFHFFVREQVNSFTCVWDSKSKGLSEGRPQTGPEWREMKSPLKGEPWRWASGDSSFFWVFYGREQVNNFTCVWNSKGEACLSFCEDAVSPGPEGNPSRAPPWFLKIYLLQLKESLTMSPTW